jgi:hypothetical protein
LLEFLYLDHVFTRGYGKRKRNEEDAAAPAAKRFKELEEALMDAIQKHKKPQMLEQAKR